MSLFSERLRDALAPDYELLTELGTGGMGSVFLVRDVALDTLRAVKVLKLELCTAESIEQFVNEARLLAELRHPNIVPVHKVDDAHGMCFYVMDYLEGETLADHLATRGRLSVDAARKLGRDLLAALDRAHRRGVIHRDVKPANIFLSEDGAVLTDFGIARRLTAERQTEPGRLRGTLAYMAPEQFTNAEPDERTDIYAAGMVIYEAVTGDCWKKVSPEQGDWQGVPSNIARVLRRALEFDPDARWHSVAAFRRALWRTREWKYQRRTIMLTTAGLVAGAALSAIWGPRALDLVRKGSKLEIRPFSSDHLGLPDPLADSIPCTLSNALRRYPDVELRGPCDPPWRWFERRAVLEGEVASTGTGIRVTVGPRDESWRIAVSMPAASWHKGVSDLSTVLFDSLLGGSRFLEPSLPQAVLPRSPVARKAFLEGEHLFAQARWGEAYASYGRATAADAGCWMCYWRHAEVGRWLGRPQDTADVAPYRRAASLFPPPYRDLIAAEARPLRRRIEGFESVVRRTPDFFFGQFRFADELFHRGPLTGRERRESVPHFLQVLRERRGDFAPAWEHLAMAFTAEGDSVQAAGAIARLRTSASPRDAVAVQIRALVEVAFACRFLSPDRCSGVIAGAARDAEAAGGTTLDAGARWLPYFDAQIGAIALGRLLANRPELSRSAWLAQAFGDLGLGRIDSARAVLRRAATRFGEAGLALFCDELDAALAVLDPDPTNAARWPAARASLAERASLTTASPDERARAAWMLAVADLVLGSPGAAAANGSPGGTPAPLDHLMTALRAASRGDVAGALRRSEALTELEANAADPDPFFRAVLHLLRANWYARLGSKEGARRELIWHENSDLFGYPVDLPQLAEVDWAFGTLARWRIATLLDHGTVACTAYRDVARLWATSDPPYRLRADSAAGRLAALGCAE